MLHVKALWDFPTLVTLLKRDLFVYRDLQQWLNQFFAKLPNPKSVQSEFSCQDNIFNNTGITFEKSHILELPRIRCKR